MLIISWQDMDPQLSEQIQIIPNPTSGTFQITLKYGGTEKVTAKVCDITGKVIEDISRGLLKEESFITVWVDLNKPRTGIYFLRIQVGFQTRYQENYCEVGNTASANVSSEPSSFSSVL